MISKRVLGVFGAFFERAQNSLAQSRFCLLTVTTQYWALSSNNRRGSLILCIQGVVEATSP